MEMFTVLNNLFDSKKIAVIQIFLSDKEKEFYLAELSKEAAVPIATTYRIVNKFLELGIIDLIKVKKFKLYKLSDNENTRYLEQFLKEEKQILKQFVKEASLIIGVTSVILHGKEHKDKANILIIGENVDANEVKQLEGSIYTKFKFKITSLTLTADQFRQMTSMGLYAGEKKVLFKK